MDEGRNAVVVSTGLLTIPPPHSRVAPDDDTGEPTTSGSRIIGDPNTVFDIGEQSQRRPYYDPTAAELLIRAGFEAERIFATGARRQQA